MYRPSFPTDLHNSLLCAPGGGLCGLHSQDSLPFGFHLDLDSGSRQQEVGGRKHSEMGVPLSLDPSLLGYCGQPTLLSDRLLQTDSPLGLVFIPPFASSDPEIMTVQGCY